MSSEALAGHPSLDHVGSAPTSKRRITWPVQSAALYVALVVVSIQAVGPVLWMLGGSLKTSDEFYTNIWGPPRALQFGNYPEAWREGQVGLFLGNSLYVTVAGLLILLVTASLAAYALARLSFPGREVVFWLILATMMVPPDILTIPLFLVVRDIGLLGTRIALSLIYAAGGFGVSVFLLRGYFQSIPRDIEDAATIDGASRLEILRRVILPLALPGFLTVVVLQAMSMWNDLFLALIFLRKPEQATVPLGLLNFFQQFSVDWPRFLAALVITTVPVVVIYVLAQRRFVQGMTSGAVK